MLCLRIIWAVCAVCACHITDGWIGGRATGGRSDGWTDMDEQICFLLLSARDCGHFLQDRAVLLCFGKS